MTAKEALELLETIYDIGGGKPHRIFNGALDFEEQEQVIKTINQALEELEAIKSADGGEALEAIDNLISITLSGNRLISNVRNYILKAQAKEIHFSQDYEFVHIKGYGVYRKCDIKPENGFKIKKGSEE